MWCFLVEPHRFWFVASTFLRNSKVGRFRKPAQVLGKRQVSEVTSWVFDSPTKHDMTWYPVDELAEKSKSKLTGKLCCMFVVPRVSISPILIWIIMFFFRIWPLKNSAQAKQSPGQVRAAKQMELQGMVGSLKNEFKFHWLKGKDVLKVS